LNYPHDFHPYVRWMTSTGTTLHLLPDEIDLPTLIHTAAGLGALAGTLINRAKRASREESSRRTERLALAAAAGALALAALAALLRAVS